MAQNATVDDDGQREPTRFDENVSADELIEGDRNDKQLVAHHVDQLGSAIQYNPHGDLPDAQLVRVTATRSLDDVHSAILLDPETETFVRASRHDSQQAWSQKEADWTVRGVGTTVAVDEVYDLERPDDETDETEQQFVQHWAEILFDDVRFTGGDRDTHDQMELDGSTLKLRDHDGRKALATISLEA
jgi:hypothetical protein